MEEPLYSLYWFFCEVEHIAQTPEKKLFGLVKQKELVKWSCIGFGPLDFIFR